jgi:hypothetical protein
MSHPSTLQQPRATKEQGAAEVMNENITCIIRLAHPGHIAILTGLRYGLSELLYTKYGNMPCNMSRLPNFLLFYTYDSFVFEVC